MYLACVNSPNKELLKFYSKGKVSLYRLNMVYEAKKRHNGDYYIKNESGEFFLFRSDFDWMKVENYFEEVKLYEFKCVEDYNQGDTKIWTQNRIYIAYTLKKRYDKEFTYYIKNNFGIFINVSLEFYIDHFKKIKRIYEL